MLCCAMQELARHRHGGGGVHDRVSEDVEALLRSKSAAELDQLRAQITSQLQAGADLDTDYWESVLAQLQLQRARTCVGAMHQRLRGRRHSIA